MKTVRGRRSIANFLSLPFSGQRFRRKKSWTRTASSESAKQVKGEVKKVVGKAVGDAKLESEGKADKLEGKVQNAIGGLKDTLKGK